MALLAGTFLLSCGVVVGVLVTEFTHYSKSNSGLVKESFALLDGSLLLGLLVLLGLVFSKRFRHASAVLLGLLPVLLLAGMLHGTEGWGPVLAPKPRPATPYPSQPPEPAAALYPGTDSARVYTFVEQMPELPAGGGIAALADTLRRGTWRRLGSPQPPVEGQVLVSFVVGPRGSLFLATIEQGLSPAVDAAVLETVHHLPRMRPGKQNGQAVAVRLTVRVRLPPEER
ncbi:energy transducer TonB [Hymenobacter sp. M29]|uniref:Energy transducer TonB n=1 Tax=Hymenobacter mellowenesis TaxID=3063995 RepID=A0ABT9ABV4_9BACT|nr:energy transducer TonB [Hymenobacter sp. M29]MDO7847314.1 energy transducer TonB [Hymenobacter sp. M29]